MERRKQGRHRKHSRLAWGGGSFVVVAVAALLVGTGVFAAAPPPSPPPPPPHAPASAPAGLIVNQPLPDPSVLVDPAVDYLYTGNLGPGATPHVPVRPFTSLDHLGATTDAMPNLPAGSSGWIWTADVRKVGSTYVMWFTTPYPALPNPAGVPKVCIAVATASSPLGPFTPATTPSICQQWGSIDPRTIVAADGTIELLWKADLNADRAATLATTIWEQPLTPSGTSLAGVPHIIATATQPWEGSLIESPDMVKMGGTYYLFFSGNASNAPANALGVMACAGISGPCADTRTLPILSTNSQGTGPGEEALFQQNGNYWMIYSPYAAYGGHYFRPMAVARVALGPAGPYIAAFAGATPGN